MVEEDNKLDAGVTRTVETIIHEYCSKAIPYQRTTSLEGVIVVFLYSLISVDTTEQFKFLKVQEIQTEKHVKQNLIRPWL